MPHVYVATNGLSIWHSADLGETLTRMPSSTGLYSGSRVWALLDTPKGLLAGTDSGIYRWDPESSRFDQMPTPANCQVVTALAIAPNNPDVMLAGTQPGAVFRSEDGGESWVDRKVPLKPHVSGGFRDDPAMAAKPNRPIARHWTRVTQIVFDPKDANAVWAGVEIDGTWRSVDGGNSWERSSTGIKTEDIHGLAVVHNGGRTLFATSNRGLYVSRDDGSNWEQLMLDSPWQYTRSIAQSADGVMFVTNGDGSPGEAGRLYRSGDHGRHWSDVRLPGNVESSVYFLATHPADPKLVFAAATLGQLYRSIDGGETWTAIKRRINEIRAVAWLP
jgi:photosystem II stability/assembly factor-like uncharacterized protein